MSYIIKKLSDPTTLKITLKLAVGWLKATVNAFLTYYILASDSIKDTSLYFWGLLANGAMWPPIEVSISSLVKRFVRYMSNTGTTQAQDEESRAGGPSEQNITTVLAAMAEKMDLTNELLVNTNKLVAENTKMMIENNKIMIENTKTMISNNQRMDEFISFMEAAYRASMSQPSLER